MNVTAPQIKRLQVLYGQYVRRSLDADATRESRLTWTSERIGRKVDSFSGLSLEEAKKLIDGLQGALGVKAPSLQPRRSQTARDGQKAGTEGRHDQIHKEETLVGPRDLARIQAHLSRLGWTEARLEAFLASPRGPNKGRTQIRTLGDANRVHWALKRMNAPSEVSNHG